VLDIACGTGWATIFLARTYQTVTGIDLDTASCYGVPAGFDPTDDQ
jgi:cyclopropane fatty-acyl-phospholipid synthase-like methyltransferase